MKAYLVTSGIVFALVLLAHIARVAVEGLQVALQPGFAVGTLVALGMCAWSTILFKRLY
ncbi:MAG: hypothetical protein V4463_19870 [Pseudomonadota bacterium]